MPTSNLSYTNRDDGAKFFVALARATTSPASIERVCQPLDLRQMQD